MAKESYQVHEVFNRVDNQNDNMVQSMDNQLIDFSNVKDNKSFEYSNEK